MLFKTARTVAMLISVLAAGCDSTNEGVTVIGNPVEPPKYDGDIYGTGPLAAPTSLADAGSLDVLALSFSSATGAEFAGSLYTFTGQAGCVDVAARVLLFTNTTSVAATAESDGSFPPTAIAVEPGQLAGIAPYNESENAIGPPVWTSVEAGVNTVVLTNSGSLHTGIESSLTDGKDYFLVHGDAENSSYALLRRGLDGGELRTVGENFASPPRIAYTTSAGTDLVILQSGEIQILRNGTAEPVFSYGDSLTEANGTERSGIKVFESSNGNVFFSNHASTRSTSEIVQTSLLTILSSSGTVSSREIPTADFPDGEFASTEPDRLYALLSSGQDGVLAEAYRLDMSAGSESWSQRVPAFSLTKISDDEKVIFSDGARSGLLTIATSSVGSGLARIYSYQDGEDTPQLRFSLNASSYIYGNRFWLARDSTEDALKLVFCAQKNGENERAYLVVVRATDEEVSAHRLSDSESSDSCAGAYWIDADNRLYFFRSAVSGSSESAPQLSFIDLDGIDFEQAAAVNSMVNP